MLSVACAIILNKGNVLVAQRSELMSLPLKWEFPGGKIEDDETPEKCIIREIKEELNIEIEIIQKLEAKIFDYITFSIELIPFVSNYIGGELILREHKDSKWLNKEELVFLDWSPADVPVLDTFLKMTYGSNRTL